MGKKKVKNLRPEVKIGDSKQYEKFPCVTGLGDIGQILGPLFSTRENRP